MLLPGRIELTTFGDVLGALHRERVFGTLYLTEPNGASHGVHFRDGFVCDVETTLPGKPLGRILHEMGVLSGEARLEMERWLMGDAPKPLGALLLERKLVSEARLNQALRAQQRTRLDALERIPSARLTFHPRPASEREPVRLEASEFLHGKVRKRSRTSTRKNSPAPEIIDARTKTRLEALRVLGLPKYANEDDVRAAFRRLASSVHPDLHPEATPKTRASLARQFKRASAAYHTLVA